MFWFGFILGAVIVIGAQVAYKKYKYLLPQWLQF